MGYQSFKELRVWQEAKALAVDVYKATASGKVRRDFSLKDQMQRSAISIASNISEGYERKSDAEFLRFLHIAKGSLSELITQVEIAREVGLLEETVAPALEERCEKLGAMLTRFIQAKRNKQ
ncbi:MAG: four helix bundle protein [Syntrophobacteraceae bacterium]|nr:four helix bundle protein [Syntrophobacteraceae bacterium]